MLHELVGARHPNAPAPGRRALGRTVTVLVVMLLVAVGVFPAPSGAVVTATPLSTDSPDHPVGPVGRVNDVAVIDSIAYIGGDFSSVGGLSRNGLAAIDLHTGNVTGWNPNVNGVIRAVEASPDGSLVYVGGAFSAIGDTTRRRLAAIDATSGLPTAWHPRPSAMVKAIDVHGSDVYIGGIFETVDGVDVPRAAKISAVTGDADPNWDPRPISSVNALQVSADGNTVYLGGSFDEIDGVTQQHAAAVRASNGTVTNWDPDVPQTVIDLEISLDESVVYLAVGGSSEAGGNTARAVSTSNGNTQWTLITDGDVQAVAAAPDLLYVGGHFDEADGTPADKLIAVEPATGQRAGWEPGMNSTLGVWSLTWADGLLMVGGDFSEIGGVAQPHFAAFKTAGQNQPPGAQFDWTCDGLSCSFDAGASGDTDGMIVDYDWEFGDGATDAGILADHTYPAPNSYPVTLTVTDDGGATGSITKDVGVGADPVHVHNLEPRPRDRDASTWIAVVVVTVRDAEETPVAGAVVSGYFGQGKDRACTTNSSGKCKVKVKVKDSKNRIPWTTTDIDAAGIYDAAANHDPNGNSDGTVILVRQP